MIKEKKKRKSTRTHKATLKQKDHVEDRSSMVGHEARLTAYIKRTMELNRKGHYLHEIAHIIAEEFNLDHVPNIATVCKWKATGLNAIDADIKALRMQFRLSQLEELEILKAKWMPIAAAQGLEIRRWKMEEGTLQPVLDENAVKEQIQATDQVVKILARQAKLLGLDLQEAMTEDGKGPKTLQELQLWIINQTNYHPETLRPVAIEDMKSGIRTIDIES